MTTGSKTVFAQKGIVVRVEVPQEIWAGESRPIFATLNGKYNDGSSKSGDVPWSYPIEWQFAEPVWEEEGTGDDITYTPRPPETADEYVPSQIVTGGHRIKTENSPLYVGDMTSSAGGLVYVRAVIYSVSVSNGEVVRTGGTPKPELTSAWVTVRAREDVRLVTKDGYETERLCVYEPDEVYGEPRYKNRSKLEALHVWMSDAPSDGAVDTIRALLYDDEYELVETSASSEEFRTATGDFTIQFNGSPSFGSGTSDALSVTVWSDDYEISNETVELQETGPETMYFLKVVYELDLRLPHVPSAEEVDHLFLDAVSSHSSRSVSVRLEETGVGTNVYADPCGLTVLEITDSSVLSPSEIDTLTVRFSSYHLGAVAVEDALEETALSSMVFSSHIVSSWPTVGYAPTTDQTLFGVLVTRWPCVVGESIPLLLSTSVDEQVAPATAKLIPGGTAGLVNSPSPVLFTTGSVILIAADAAPGNDNPVLEQADTKMKAYMNAHKYHEFLAQSHIWVRNLERRLRSEHRDLTNAEFSMTFLVLYYTDIAAVAYVHGGAVIGTTYASARTHVEKIGKIISGSLAMGPKKLIPLYRDKLLDLVHDERVRGEQWKETVTTPLDGGEKVGTVLRHYMYDLYYTQTHGATTERKEHFAGLKLKQSKLLSPEQFGDAYKHQPALVFLNGCATRLDPEHFSKSSAGWALYKRFNAKCYVGWDALAEAYKPGEVTHDQATKAAEAFFQTLQEGKTVADAIEAGAAAKTDDKNSQPQFAYWGTTDIEINKTSKLRKLAPSWPF